MKDDSVENLFQSFPRKGNSGMGRDVHSLTLSIQLFLCRPRTAGRPYDLEIKSRCTCKAQGKRAQFNEVDHTMQRLKHFASVVSRKSQRQHFLPRMVRLTDEHLSDSYDGLRESKNAINHEYLPFYLPISFLPFF